VPLAYLILAHRQPPLVARLFAALHHPADTFVLHFDARAPAELHALGRRLAAAHRNVRLLRPRPIFWGGPAMMEAQVEAMAAALAAGPDWTHFINLTGQDFPLRGRDAILARLAEAGPGRSFVGWFDPLAPPQPWRNAAERVGRFHPPWPWLHRALALPGLGRRLRAAAGWTNRLPALPGYRRPPPPFRYFGGPNHVVLARAAVRHLVHDPAARRIRRWLRGAAHSDEIVFQSVLLNSPLAPTVVNASLREIDFPPHAPHPRTFTAADLPRLLASPALFARKFDLAADPGVVAALAARLPVSLPA
jgi:hypothetical protein